MVSRHPATVAGALYLLLVACALVYLPGLSGGLLLDDHHNLAILADFDKSLIDWHAVVWENPSGLLGRPVPMLTFAANTYFNGLDPYALKYTNLMIHLLCGTLVFWLAGRLLPRFLPANCPLGPWWLALALTAMWLLAPLLVSTTLYIVQRMAQLASLFMLAGLIVYVAGREQLGERPRRGWLLILSTIVIWLPLGVMSKENGALLPLLMFVVEAFAFRFQAPKKHRAGLVVFYAIVLAAPAAAALIVMLWQPDVFFGSYSGRAFTAWERLLTESRALFFYVSNLLIPHGASMGLFHDDFPVSTGMFAPLTTILSVIGWLTIIAAAVLGTPALRALGFGMMFYLAGHALESTVFPLELVFEHRNYLPSFGIFFSLTVGLAMLAEKPILRKPSVALLILLPALYGFGTYQRSHVWSSWDSILLAAEEGHPGSPRLHVELASLYSALGAREKALEQLELVEQTRSSSASGASLHRLIVYCENGAPIPLTAYSRIPPRMALNDAGIYAINSLRGLNKSLHEGRCPQLDIDRLRRALARWIENAPSNKYEGRLWDIRYELAQLLRYEGDLRGAINELKAADSISPSRPEALLVAIRYQLEGGDLRGAQHSVDELRRRFANADPRNQRLIARYQPIIDAVDSGRTQGGTH